MSGQLIFDPTDHRYTVDGVEYPSITTLIKPLTSYDQVPAFMLEKAGFFGTNVHAGCESLFEDGTIDEVQYTPEELLCISGFPVFMEEHPSLFADRSRIHTEKKMAHHKLKYAGTPDITIDGVAMIEIKTRAFNKLTDPLQLAAQENLWIANGGIKGPYDHLVLELRKDGSYKVVIAKHGQAWPKFRFLLEHHWRCIEHAQKIELWRKK